MTEKKMCDCNQGRLPCTCKPQTDGVLAWAELKDGELVAKEGFVVTCTGVGQYTVQTVEQAQGLSRAHQPHGEPVALPERDVLRDIVAQAIGGDTYDCTRVWSAWGVGTMSEDDFVPVVEQDERLYEIADACLDEIAKLGPLYPRPVQGEPVGEVVAFGKGLHEIAWAKGVMPMLGVKLYAHADPGEAERMAVLLRQTQVKNSQERDTLRAQLAELDALRSFANEIISAAYEGGSFEGGDIQDMAVKHGLLRIESRAEECGKSCACLEYGFPAECYRKTALLSASAEPSAPKCKTCHDQGEVFVRKGDVHCGMQTEPEPVMAACPECAEPSAMMRAEFETHYADEFSKIRSPNVPFTAADVKALRSGEGYGDRAYLNGQWKGWQARAALERKP